MHFTGKNHKTYKYSNCTKQAPTKTPDVMWMLDDVGKDQYSEDVCVPQWQHSIIRSVFSKTCL